MAKSIIEKKSNTEKVTLLKDWQDKFDDAKRKYGSQISEIKDNREAYEGTRKIKNPSGNNSSKQTSNVRKVCFELVETQVDTTIPLPKVISRDGYEDQATTIEMFLKNEADRLPLNRINDEQGRSTPTDGGSVFFLEWDNSKSTRKTVGDLRVVNVDSTQVYPQPGVYLVEEMDYIFLVFEQTRFLIEEKYGVHVEDEDGDSSINEDLLCHVFCFYKNSNGEIGLFSYVGDTIVQNFENYYARQQTVCNKCGRVKSPLDEVCKDCGSKSFKKEIRESEKMNIVEMVLNPLTGQPTPIEKEMDVPYYVPNFFPIVIRKNFSKQNVFLGGSDVSYIKDQQNDLSIYSAKIREKLLKGGSVLIKPKDLKFAINDEELKIIDVENPSQMAMIDVKNLQPDISKDLALLDTNYTIARQTIGITDSYQGRQDATATSGKAKEIAATQAAGRLVSKKKNKEDAFGKLYEYMFKFMLAYADEPRMYAELNVKGEMEYKVFDKRDFILMDDNGKYFYNDDFIFTTDVSSTLSNNREAMWQETRMNFTSGAYGNPTDLGTIIMFWNVMNMLHYPGAKQSLKFLEQRKVEAEMIRQQELVTNTIADRNMEQVLTRNKLNELDLQNQVSQLRGNQVQPNMGGNV